MTGLEQTFAVLWRDGVGVKTICHSLGIWPSQASRLRQRLGLPPRKPIVTAPDRWRAMAARSAARASRRVPG
jgi:hypothetical protein